MMYLKKLKRGDRLHLSIVESYRKPGKKNPTTKTVKTLGYLDELDHPIEYYEDMAKKMTKAKDDEKMDYVIQLDPNEKMPVGYQSQKNLGYVAIQHVYHLLGIDKFMNNHTRHRKFKFNMNNIFKLFVSCRLINPGSKKSDFENKDKFFESNDFSLDDIYHSLDFLHEKKEALINYINKQITNKLGRDTTTTYYDVTNYYFEIDDGEGLKQKGVSKENRRNPIIQMGLLTDTDGIPINYNLYAGNTNDCETYRPFITKAKKELNLGRIVVVADKAMNTGDNIAYTLANGNGYIFSQTVRGASKEIKEYVLNDYGYKELKDGFKIKSRLEPRTIYVSKRDGKGEKTGRKAKYNIDEKQVVFYSPKYAQRAKREREKAIEKALKIINNPSSYKRLQGAGVNGLIKNMKVDKETGEVLNPHEELYLDWDKIREDEKLDGYYIISTSEYKMSDEDIIGKYKELWRIEETFKLSKTTIETRPIYLSTQEHIEGHFLICFTAILIARILEKLLDKKYSASVIINELRKNNYQLVGANVYQGSYHSEVLQDIGEKLNIPFGSKNLTLGNIKKIIADVKKH